MNTIKLFLFAFFCVIYILFPISASFCQVSIYHDTTSPQQVFAAQELKKAVQGSFAQIKLERLAQYSAVTNNFQIIIGTNTNSDFKKHYNTAINSQIPAIADQGYIIKTESLQKKKNYWIIGGDHNGAMYGALQLATYFRLYGFERDFDEQKQPYIKWRGIKLNIPLDKRAPSYDDDGDAANVNIKNMWDLEFWTQYFDQLARYRYNVISFWNCHPFNAMCKIPDYPDTAIEDVHDYQGLIKKMSIDEKVQFWTTVFNYAKSRGFRIFWFNWNVFAYGAVGKYGIEDKAANEACMKYSQKALLAFLKTYPQIDAFGVSAGEHFSGWKPEQREEWMYNTWGKAMENHVKENPQKSFLFIHRYLMTGTSSILKYFKNLPYPMDFSFKYAVGHMHGYEKPTLIYEKGVVNDVKKNNLKLWLNLRNDDMFYYRWNDPDYARAYIKNLPGRGSFLKGYYMGSDGYVFGKTFTFNKEFDLLNNKLEINKHWINFMQWGQLGYDPELSNDYFIQQIALKFPSADAEKLFEVWQLGSKIIPTVTSANWSENDAKWYPEGCYSKKGFIDLKTFAYRKPQPGAPIYSIQEYKNVVLKKSKVEKTTPLEIAAKLRKYGKDILWKLKHIKSGENIELKSLLLDIKGMAYLGLYYANKFEGATNYVLKKKTMAIMNMKAAKDKWNQYADIATIHYIPQNLARMNAKKNLSREGAFFSWHDLLKDVNKDIEIAKK